MVTAAPTRRRVRATTPADRRSGVRPPPAYDSGDFFLAGAFLAGPLSPALFAGAAFLAAAFLGAAFLVPSAFLPPAFFTGGGSKPSMWVRSMSESSPPYSLGT